MYIYEKYVKRHRFVSLFVSIISDFSFLLYVFFEEQKKEWPESRLFFPYHYDQLHDTDNQDQERKVPSGHFRYDYIK